MIRGALSKVMWVGRATVFVVGLAVILAMVMGLASAAFSATGGNFILGQSNSANAPTTLVGKIVDTTKSALVLKNPNGGSALQLQVNSGQAPMTVNSTAGKATNLNADKLDGQDSPSFALASRTPMWAVVKADGTLLRSTGDVSGIIHPEAGFYRVNFNRNIGSCAYSATIDEGLWGEISVWRYAPDEPSLSGEVSVVTRQSQSSSNAPDAVDKPFQLVVFC